MKTHPLKAFRGTLTQKELALELEDDGPLKWSVSLIKGIEAGHAKLTWSRSILIDRFFSKREGYFLEAITAWSREKWGEG